ncbi:MAG: CBM96 family carbohydrate-binding protein, partial [Candidatus Thorarchaeota archaeon]
MKKTTTFLVFILCFSMILPVLHISPDVTSESVSIDDSAGNSTLAATPGSNTHVVRVSDDTFTSAESPDTNFDSSNSLSCGRDVSDNTGRIWMKFNLTHIARNAHFTRATVNLFMTGGETTMDEPLGLYYSSNDTWNETTITHNNAPVYDPTPVDTIDSPSHPDMFITQNWYEWEVTSEVLQTLDEDGILTFVLTRVDETSTEESLKQFSTREYAISQQKNIIPNLALEYDIPTTSELEVDGFSTSPKIDYIKNANPELSWTLNDADVDDFQKNYELEFWNSSTYDETQLSEVNNSIISIIHDTGGVGSAGSGPFSSGLDTRLQLKWPASKVT